MVWREQGVIILGVLRVDSCDRDQTVCIVVEGLLVVLGRKLTITLIANTGQASFNRPGGTLGNMFPVRSPDARQNKSDIRQEVSSTVLRSLSVEK